MGFDKWVRNAHRCAFNQNCIRETGHFYIWFGVTCEKIEDGFLSGLQSWANTWPWIGRLLQEGCSLPFGKKVEVRMLALNRDK